MSQRRPKQASAASDPRLLLEQHRRDIEALDRRILHLTCERLELARQIGELKSSLGVPLRNFRVEAQVRGRFAEACGLLGLDRELGDDLALFLIQKAVEEQATLMDAGYQGDHLKALVVGGKGGMGGWIAGFLHGQGHDVSVLDPAPGETPFTEVAVLDEQTCQADLVVVAVPMTECSDVLDQLAGLGPRGVVAEMCSLKSHLSPRLGSWLASGLRLVLFHPLFGPGVRMLSGRKIVFCTDGDAQAGELVRGLFAETSAELVEMSMSEHDRRMGLVLGLSHLSNLVFARALMHSGIGPEELAEVAGVTFSKQLATSREVTAENPRLYYQIQALNPSTPETGHWLRKALDELIQSAGAESSDGFAALMAECRDFLSAGDRAGGAGAAAADCAADEPGA